jgi:hypothetical protein
MIRRYFSLLVEEGHPGAIGRMKQFASWFTHGVEGGARLRKAIYDSREARQILDEVDRFFLAPKLEEDAAAEGDATRPLEIPLAGCYDSGNCTD